MNKITNRQVICDTLLKAAEQDRDIVVVCSDSRGSASLSAFADKFPRQFVRWGLRNRIWSQCPQGWLPAGKRYSPPPRPAFSPPEAMSRRRWMWLIPKRT